MEMINLEAPDFDGIQIPITEYTICKIRKASMADKNKYAESFNSNGRYSITEAYSLSITWSALFTASIISIVICSAVLFPEHATAQPNIRAMPNDLRLQDSLFI